jgi:hypothetical protein
MSPANPPPTMTTFFTQENTISDTTIKDDALGVALPAEAPPAARKAGAPAGRPAGKTNNGMAITSVSLPYTLYPIAQYTPTEKGGRFRTNCSFSSSLPYIMQPEPRFARPNSNWNAFWLTINSNPIL